LLLAPGAGAATELLRADPLRLLSIAQTRVRNVAATASADASGALSADEGRARFVLVTTEGSTLRSEDAERIVASLENAIATVLPRHPGVRAAIAGGPAIARDAKRLIQRDLVLSSVLSTVLVAAAFLVTFRRARALVAIAPPLLIGTLWTTAVAALLPGGITAIAMGFASVVIGVGLDTGVHVYVAVVRARAKLSTSRRTPSHEEVGEEALSHVARPTLTAAIAAAFAFGAMTLSRLPALRQLGVLCASGEVLTALAILALTPRIASWLEKDTRGERPFRAMDTLGRAITGRAGVAVVAMGVLVCAVLVAIVGPPKPASALVAVKPKGLPSLAAQDEAIKLASSGATSLDPTAQRADAVQLVIVQRAAANDEQGLLARGELVAAKVARDGREVDALSTWLPSDARIAERLAARDRLDLPAKAQTLSRVLDEVGFAAELFEPALDHLRAPASLDDARRVAAKLREGPLAPLVARHLSRDADSGELLLATYVRAPSLYADALARDVAEVDAGAVVTGYPVLEASLRAALARDLPRVAIVALVLVAIALRSVLRGARDVIVAMTALAAELVIVALVMRVLHIPLHVYDALVLPVLLGITVDESMFLLHAMHEGDVASALRREGRAIVTTALTTAAGFAALLVCGFPGLRDLGAVGLAGTLAGLLCSLLVVPAVARAAGLGRARVDLDDSVPSTHKPASDVEAATRSADAGPE
jgi:predicted RND superfamily exporter protein